MKNNNVKKLLNCFMILTIILTILAISLSIYYLKYHNSKSQEGKNSFPDSSINIENAENKSSTSVSIEESSPKGEPAPSKQLKVNNLPPPPDA